VGERGGGEDMKKLRMTDEEFNKLQDDYAGVCMSCGEVNYGCEPDMEGGECEECGAEDVMGIEDALIAGVVVIIKEKVRARA
jgi:hypothetical protein